jgi:hypothetical protein
MSEQECGMKKKENCAWEVLKDWPYWVIPVLAFAGLCFLISHFR